MRGVLLAAMVMVPTAGARPAQADMDAAASLSIRVDLSERTLTVLRDGEEVESYPVAVGQPSYPTPTGSFRIAHIVWNPRWVPPDAAWARKKKETGPGDPDNPMGRVKLFFQEPDYYIHGTHELDSLGQAESHGCIRMRNSDAIELAKMVMKAGGEAREPSWFRRVLDRVTSTRQVYLSDPVPVEIRK